MRRHSDLGSKPRSDAGALVDFPSGTVTFVFTDLEGSTRLWQEHPDTMGAASAGHDAILREAVESNRGQIVKTTGDGMLAVFALARDAIDATIASQVALRSQPWSETGPLRVRIGVHTGSAEQRDGDYHATTVNQAARLMGAAHGGQIVCSGVVAALVADRYELIDMGLHRFRDLETALRVSDARPGARRHLRKRCHRTVGSV